MGAEWEEADQYLLSMAEELIEEHHAHLKHANVGFLYRDKAAKSGETFVYGKARKVADKDKVFMEFDFIIWIAKEEFERLENDRQRALVDHELCHCAGFPGGWKMRHHDVEEFVDIVIRHGLWNPALKQIARSGQQLPLMAEERRGSVASVPGSLLERAREDPEALMTEIYKEAQLLKDENGGTVTISQLQRKLRIGYSQAAAIKDLLDQVSGE